MNVWSGEIARRARELAIVAEDEAVIVGSPALSEQEQLQVGGLVSRVLRLLVALPDRLGKSHLDYALEHLRLRNEAARIVLCQEKPLSEDTFARADLVRRDGEWKLLEMNVGSTVGGMFYTSLPRLAGFPQPHDALKTWAEIMKQNYCEDVRHIAIVEDVTVMDALRPQFSVLAEELSEHVGVACSIVTADELWLEDGVLTSSRGRVDCIYRFFNEKDVLRSPDQYFPLMNALANDSVSMPMGFATQLLSNKGALALLHELVQTPLLNDEEKALVTSVVPYTCHVTQDNIHRLLDEPERWVVKPTDSACGQGVRYGGELTESEWCGYLEKITSTPGETYIAQEFCKAECAPTVFSLSDGGNITEAASVVWGVYVYGDRYLGTLVRAKPRQDTIVINHASGASVGPLSG
ncbi:circularly permuted type 2 ATP-grasp protein [Pseudomonas mosselii]|uniref:circularly permuted type 2 ATP-grasp protein n=1 Tax=Pseudomonas mosselii TaxID=78327 RepID=UPI0021A265EF|nr:circularly permuted type 2 ATP-grasp protein [Pseudomonas mosselii]MEA3234653.1 circularly permuted type 2 ATP-grasp protein [Pseudomonas mosselii]UWS65782.1 circularly permuted type 2 ATP-grasp protein [Pseudomonas mosselii]